MNPDLVRKQYKNKWSNYRQWQIDHKEDSPLLYQQNISPHIAIDEVTLSRGELYTYITARNQAKGQPKLIASIKGTKAEDIINAVSTIPLSTRDQVKEVSADMAAGMRLAVSALFPKASLVTDRFHVVKLIQDALQHIRVKYRWKAIDEENKRIQQHKQLKTRTAYLAPKLENGETARELLARSRFLLYRHKKHWTNDQKERAKVLFKNYPLLKTFYHHTLRFRAIYKLKTKQEAKRKIVQWLYLIKQENKEEFNTVAQSIQYHINSILNFFDNRSKNASAESFNAAIKGFRANLRGVSNVSFFRFRMEKLFA